MDVVLGIAVVSRANIFGVPAIVASGVDIVLGDIVASGAG